MTVKSLLKLPCVLIVIYIVLVAPLHSVEAAISCKVVQENLSPCIPHLKGSGPTQAMPPEKCCAGVRSVKTLAQTTGEHKAVCQCMKAAASETIGLNYDLAAKLPAHFGVSMSYTFSPKTECNNI